VGVVNDRGEIATLRRNDNLSTYAATDADRLSVNNATFNTERYDFEYRNYAIGGTYVNLFGVPARLDNVGEFKVVNEDGIIVLSPEYPYDHVILEYIPSPIANGDYLMPVLLREALISWIRWNDRRSLPAGRRSNLGQRQMDRKDFYDDLKVGKKLMKKFRLEEANDVIRLNNRLSVKA
jgi:hypothetical protein